MFRLDNKVAVVTGGSGVLGRSMSLALARQGATVVILARTEAKTQSVAEEIRAAGGQALGVAADVLDRASLERAAETIVETVGRVDILVNAAGGNRPQAIAAPGGASFFDLPAEALEYVFDLNFMGTLNACQVFGRIMAGQGEGVVLNVSSMAAQRPLTRVVAYAAAKAAIDNFTRWLSVYLSREVGPGLRVNAIAPGFFLGEQNRALLVDQTTGELTARGRQIVDHTPMGRFGEPQELDGTVIWLCSDASRFVTGVVVPVDGGFSAYSGV
jgi:NAD(P)-dependent dehydrogenase (short-subunit alcohol dehydrogenase family)